MKTKLEDPTDICLNYTPPTHLTKEDAAIVRDLMWLYELVSQSHAHARSCECEMCAAIESCGSHEYRTFDTLEDKANR